MTEPGNLQTPPSPVRQPVLLGLFSGTALGAGYLLSGVPNVELVSLIVALGGAVLGPVLGPVCGLLTGAVFALANPLGMSPPLLVAAQALGQGLMGFWGWLAFRLVGARPVGRPDWRGRSAGLGAGVLGTLVYDLLTVAASWVLFPDASLKVVLLNASSFVLLHTGVNAAIFFLLFAPLARRLGTLARTSLVGRQAAVVLLLGGLLVPEGRAAEPVSLPDSLVAGLSAPPDSLLLEVSAQPDSLLHATTDSLGGPSRSAPARRGPSSWQRPLWDPFPGSLLEHLDRRTPWIPVTDGGLGSMALLLGEASTAYAPEILRDDLPDGTGHRLTDDLWLAGTQGLVVRDDRGGFWDAGDGALELTGEDLRPEEAISRYRGIKGPHESYMRGISLLTPRTAWRLGFDFEENIDRLGYNWTELPDENFSPVDVPRGNSSIRRGRARLERRPTPGSSFAVEYRTARKTRDELSVLDAEVQEIWSDGIRLDTRQRRGDWRWRSALFWTNRTVEWGALAGNGAEQPVRRKIETGREGVLFHLERSPRDTSIAGPGEYEEATVTGTGLQVYLSRWDVLDDAGGTSWSAADLSASRATGRVAATVAMTAPVGRVQLGLTGDYLEGAGLHPGGFVQWSARRDDPVWRLRLERAGRAPRSDELLTPLSHHVLGRELVMLPASDLEHENLLRAALLLKGRLLGFDLALDTSLRRLSDGITWVAEEPGALSGTWRNALEMNSTRVTASLAREGRLLGWARARLEGTWQNFDETTARAAFLPPEKYLRMELMWEQHFFREDGIVQLALLTTHRGPLDDPWDPTRQVTLPAGTTHDFLVGFRLVGAHLSMNFRNLTDQRVRLSSAALSPGRELDLRLDWTFLY